MCLCILFKVVFVMCIMVLMFLWIKCINNFWVFIFSWFCILCLCFVVVVVGLIIVFFNWLLVEWLFGWLLFVWGWLCVFFFLGIILLCFLLFWFFVKFLCFWFLLLLRLFWFFFLSFSSIVINLLVVFFICVFLDFSNLEFCL